MYGEGGAEEIVGEVLAGRRSKVFLVSKVYPHNASRKGAIAACERSLGRLKTDFLDLYLLHWRGSYPLSETVEGFEALVRDGKIRQWGVSNLDADDMKELRGVANGGNCAADQVMYNAQTRGIEWDLLDLCRKSKIAIMAYSPLGQGPLLRKAPLKKIAEKHAVDAAAIALAWVLRNPGMVVIPKATQLDHVRANAKALDVKLDAEDLKALDAAFPPPKGGSPLEMT
jgi:diketogulonate reductase-like aldo/keto reductase